MKQYQTKPASYEDQLKTYLEFLHNEFVIVNIDKVSNNYMLIWANSLIAKSITRSNILNGK